MKKKLTKICAVICIAAALTGFTVPSSAAGSSDAYGQAAAAEARVADARAIEREYSLFTVSQKSVYAYSASDVYLGSQNLGGIGRVINGEVYIPIRQFISSVSSLSVNYNSSSRTITVTGGGHNVSVSDGAYALYANGRVFFSSTPSVILSNGRMYVPARTLARAFSLTLTQDGSAARLTGNIAPVKSGASFYDADAVYWLSRIISAESRGEPLIGQIAVGNVVLNRVRSSAFPNTIWGVIFDRKYGVQFSPVANGTIYQAPTASAVLAAKICLDGFSVSPDALYFLRPSASESSWIVKNREYLFTIRNHYFFA